MFQINDTVVYGAQGVCRIEEISKREMAGKAMDYYVLKPVYDSNSTLFVPVSNDKLTAKMRRVSSPEEIVALISSMPGENAEWIENENERKERYKEAIARGNRRELIQIIKSLYLHQQKLQEKGKRLHLADDRIFREAERMLYDEFALVLHIKREQVLPFILQQLGAEEKEGA